MIFERTKRESH